MKVADLDPPKFRASVFMRRVLRSRFQRWMLSVGIHLRDKLAAASARVNCSLDDWSLLPADGVWDFNLSRKGLRPCSPICELRTPGST